MIADQRIEDHVVEEAQDLRRTGARGATHQIEALGQIGTTFILVFHFGHHAQRLAEIFLMKALPVPWGNDDPVVALDQQEAAIQDDVDSRFGRLELHGLSQCHAEAFVDHTVLNGDDSGLQDVGAGRALKGQADALAIEHHRQFVLGACQ